MKIVSTRIRGSLIAIVAAIVLAVSGGIISSVNTAEVQAEEGCTKSGEAKFVGGTMVCDCTITTVNTCACIVPCPPSND